MKRVIEASGRTRNENKTRFGVEEVVNHTMGQDAILILNEGICWTREMIQVLLHCDWDRMRKTRGVNSTFEVAGDKAFPSLAVLALPIPRHLQNDRSVL
jgi:hypothetical protein